MWGFPSLSVFAAVPVALCGAQETPLLALFSGDRSKGLTPIGSGVLELLQVKPSAWKQGMNRDH